MSVFVFWFSTVLITLLAALMAAMPALIRPTLPLGVSVPQARVREPVVRNSVRRYRIAIGAAWIVGVALTVLLFTSFPVAASIAPMLVTLALGLGAYVVSRATIVRAKRDGRWYENVRVRLSAEITTPSDQPRPPIGWGIAAVIILLAVTAVGVALYPTLPDPTPTHWNAAGVVDGFAPKSIWAVFGPILVGFGVVGVLFACSFLVRLSPLRAVPSDNSAQSTRRTTLQRRLMTSLLGQLAVVIALQIAWLTLTGWLAPGTSAAVFGGVIGLLVLLVAVMVVFFLRYRTTVASWRAPAGPGRSNAPDAPDDDRYWKGGFVYVNRNDPAVFVPKRFGVGWTVNLGSAGGMAMGIALLVVVVGAIVLAVVAPGLTHRV